MISKNPAKVVRLVQINANRYTEEEYKQLVMVLDNLIDEVGEDESHPLASLIEVIGVLIENYENQNVPELV